MVAKQANTPCVPPASQLSPSSCLSLSSTHFTTRESSGRCLKTLGPFTHMGDLEAHSSWL